MKKDCVNQRREYDPRGHLSLCHQERQSGELLDSGFINRIPLSTNQGFKNTWLSKTLNEQYLSNVAVALTELVPEMEANSSGSTVQRDHQVKV